VQRLLSNASIVHWQGKCRAGRARGVGKLL
jgi:hypothetical protein